MRESLDLPNLPEYVSIKDAAKLLGVSDKRVYAYIEDGRLPAVRAAHVIMIPLEEVKKFKPKIPGRPRKNTPLWRTSPPDNTQFVISINVNAKVNQQQLQERLEEIRSKQEHIFPGTTARYIILSNTNPKMVQILLMWRGTALPEGIDPEQALKTFREALSDILDWGTAQYDNGRIFLHT